MKGGSIMDNITMFPLSAGFLFPNGEYFSTDGRGHQRLAYEILKKNFGMNGSDINDPEFTLQEKYSAILIRYRWGEKLIYLPKTAPPTRGGRLFFKNAVDFYHTKGFQIMNLYKISLEDEFSIIENFIEDQYEQIKLFTICTNFTNIIIKKPDGNYMYNPERTGD